jgi:hypothetical protein
MKRQPSDSVALAERLRAFMVEAGWHSNRKSRGLTFFSPPDTLGIRGKYTIALPDDPGRPSVAGFIHEAANSLVQIYGYGQLGELLTRAASLSDFERSTKIVSRFLDDSTTSGAIPLAALSAYVSNMEVTLYRSAKFRLGADSKTTDLTARQFAKDCLFLQTAAGSFIAKVEIPPTVLRQPNLFGQPQLDSTEVASSLFTAIRFVNERILGSDAPFDDDETLSSVIALFDVELLAAIADVLLEPEMQSIEFSFELGNSVQMTSTGWMSSERRDRLKDFVAFVTEQLRGEDNIDITGAIVELRSRDPDGDRNHIRVAAQFFGDRTFFSATLTNQQYQRAVDAHRNKRDVRLAGRGIRLKTQVRMVDLAIFE